MSDNQNISSQANTDTTVQVSVPVELQIKNPNITRQFSRRQAMQWVMAAMAVISVDRVAENASGNAADAKSALDAAGTAGGDVAAAGYGVDPKLAEAHQPGAFWPLTMNDAQKKTSIALCDAIIPEDDLGPAASDVGVPEMLDEWISAPYPNQVADRPIILDGLAWIDVESRKRFNVVFTDLKVDQKNAICDDICFTKTAKPEFRKAAVFFTKFRTLSASAYYSTPAGWKAVGYVGNIPLPKFEGPPKAVLDKLGVTQTVVD